MIKANNASVTAASLFLRRGDFVEENFDDIFLVQAGSREAAIVRAAALAESDHFFGYGSGGFGFCERGRDPLMLNKTADQVGQHGIAVLAGAAELSGAFEVAHRGDEGVRATSVARTPRLVIEEPV